MARRNVNKADKPSAALLDGDAGLRPHADMAPSPPMVDPLAATDVISEPLDDNSLSCYTSSTAGSRSANSSARSASSVGPRPAPPFVTRGDNNEDEEGGEEVTRTLRPITRMPVEQAVSGPGEEDDEDDEEDDDEDDEEDDEALVEGEARSDEAASAAAVGAAAMQDGASLERCAGERYMDLLMTELQYYLASFDGTTQSLRMHPQARLSVDTTPALPANAEVFQVPWFGVAWAIVEAAMRASMAKVTVGNGETTGLLPCEACARLVSGLGRVLHRLLINRECGVRGGTGMLLGAGAHHAAGFVTALEAFSRKRMTMWANQDLQQQQPPSQSQEDKDAAMTTATDQAAEYVGTLAELNTVLRPGLERWLASFYPALQYAERASSGAAAGALPRFLRDYYIEPTMSHLPRNGQPARRHGGVSFLDEPAETTAASKVTAAATTAAAAAAAANLTDSAAVEELATDLYTYYSLATLVNLMTRDDHPDWARGALVPRDWLRRFVTWCEAARQHVCGLQAATPQSAPLPSLGPMDTFRCVKVVASCPAKHWLALHDDHDGDDEESGVDVVPERLFDALFMRFGGGPKYMLYGPFTLKAQVLQALTPCFAMVSLTFTTHGNAEGVKSEQSVTVYVEEVLPQTTVAEVLRLGLELVREASGTMSAAELDHWSAGLYRSRAVRLLVKEHHGHYLKPPVALVSDFYEMSMLSLVAQLPPQAAAAAASGRQQQAPCPPHDGVALEVTLRTAQDANDVLAEGDAEVLVTADSIARRGVCGLTNSGNTCYMNSALQSLSNLTPFRLRLLALPLSHFPLSPTVSVLVRLISMMWSGQYRYVAPLPLKRAIGRLEKRFAGSEQEDANEFIEVLLDRIHEELNRIAGRRYRERRESDKTEPTLQLAQAYWDDFLANNRSFVPELFFHQSKTRFACLTCGESNIVFDNNLTLSVNIKEAPRRYGVNVIVFVQVPHTTPAVSPNAAPDLRCCFALKVFVRVRLRDEMAGEPAAEDVAAAVRKVLRGNAQVQKRVHAILDLQRASASAMCAAQDNMQDEEQDVTATVPEAVSQSTTQHAPVDFAMTMLEGVERDKCFACATVQLGSATAAPEATATATTTTTTTMGSSSGSGAAAEPGAATARTTTTAAATTQAIDSHSNGHADSTQGSAGDSRSAMYHVCYFLKGKSDRFLTTAGTLLYVEAVDKDLVARPDTPHDHAGAAPQAVKATHADPSDVTPINEEDEEAPSTKLNAESAPVTMHILATARQLAEQAVQLRWPTAAELDDVDDASPVETRHASNTSVVPPDTTAQSAESEGDASASSPQQHPQEEATTQPPARCPLLRVQHMVQSFVRCIDVAASAARIGDGWLPAVDTSCTPANDRAGRQSGGVAALHAGPNEAHGVSSSSLSTTSLAEEEGNNDNSNHDGDEGVSPPGQRRCPASVVYTPRTVFVFVVYDDEVYTVRDIPVSRHSIYIPVISADEDDEAGENDSTLYDCLRNAMQPDTLTGDDAWYCPRCKTFRDAVVQRSVFRLPPCLLISFKRFKMQTYADKNNTVVQFPVKLDLAPYLDPEAGQLAQQTQYRLRSVVYHSGSLRSGHYVATAYNDAMKRWICFNDWNTSIVPGTVPQPRNAYILCYERVEAGAAEQPANVG